MKHDLWEYQSPFFSSVGEAISIWSSMEGRLVEIGAQLLGTSEEKAGVVFYSVPNFFGWLSIIDDLFNLDEKYQEAKQVWGRSNNRLRGLNDLRVRLAHHTIWDYDDIDDIFLRPAKYDTRPKSRKSSPLSREEIESFTSKVQDVEDELIDIVLMMRRANEQPS